MKCLSRIEIQEYLDRELEPPVMKNISGHLEKCEACSKSYRQAVADKALIGKIIGKGGDIDKTISIPEFAPPVLYNKRTSFYRLIPYIIAASIFGLIVLLRTNKQPAFEKIPEAELLMFEFYEGKDLNKMWHEKSQIFILQDAKGNIIQSITTN